MFSDIATIADKKLSDLSKVVCMMDKIIRTLNLDRPAKPIFSPL